MGLMENSQDQEGLSTDESAFDFEVMEAITRLLIGGALEGSDELINRLRVWEQETAVSRTNTATTPPDPVVQLRYTLIGALFSAEARFKKTQLPFLKRVGKLGVNIAATTIAPFTKMGASSGVNAQLDDWAKRGETILTQWAKQGQVEEQHGRILARHATNESFNELLNQLAENKELQNLIAEQSTGLAAEALDQARERTVSADEIAERLVRTILRRPLRQASLPANITATEETHG